MQQKKQKNTILRAGIAAILTLTMLVSLAACKEEGDITPGPTAKPEQPTVIVNNEAIPEPRTIVVSGYGVVTVEPDFATINIVTAGASGSSEEAATLCETATQQVLDTAGAQSVLTRNITTSGVTIDAITRESDGAVTGYIARQTITIHEDNISRVNTILSPIIDAKIIDSYEVTYSLLDASSAYAEALAKAVTDSRIKAEAIATAGSVALDEMILVNEAPVENQLVGVVFKSSSINVEANLTVTFSVKDAPPVQ